jgi:hypothetical protein
MPATSKSQQRFFGMVHALQQGKLDTEDLPAAVAAKVKKTAKTISAKDAKDFAATKHAGLPNVKEGTKFSDFLRLTESPLLPSMGE